MAGGDAAEEIVHEGCVAGGIGEGGEGGGAGGAGADAVAVGGMGGVLLLEVDEAVGDGGRVNAVGYFHAAGRDVAEEIPPFRVVGEGGVGDAGNEAGDVEEVVDLGEVGVREGVAGEASEDASGSESAGCEDGFGDFTRGPVMAKEDDALLSEHGVDEDDDGMGVGATGGEVRVQHEGLGGGGVGGGEGLDEFDEGEVANGFGRDTGRDFDRDGNAVVYDFGFEFMGVAGNSVPLSMSLSS